MQSPQPARNSRRPRGYSPQILAPNASPLGIQESTVQLYVPLMLPLSLGGLLPHLTEAPDFYFASITQIHMES